MNFKINSPESKEAAKSYIDKLPIDKMFEVNVTKRKEIRSLPQNKLYWLWIGCISAETGNDKKDLHEYFSDSFLPIENFTVFGIKFERSTSTTKLDSKQFTYYLDRIQQFASSELGLILPDPKDLYFAQFYEQYKDFI